MRYCKINSVVLLTLTFVILFSLDTRSQIVIEKAETSNVSSIANDSIHLRIIYDFSQQALKEDAPMVLRDTMALDIGAKWSVYYNFYKEKRDSLRRKEYREMTDKITSISVNRNADLATKLEMKSMGPDYSLERKDDAERLYKNKEQNELLTIDKISKDEMGVLTEYLSPFEWEIKSETDSILNYPCVLATTSFRGRTYNVWFTLDIPINEGPWKLYGLPGLILKAATTDGIFQFQAIGIENVEGLALPIPNVKEIEGALVCKDFKQLQTLKRRRDEYIAVGNFKGGDLSLYRVKNPVEKNLLELTAE